MPTITAIKRQRHSQRRVNIDLNGTFAFGLALNQTDFLHVGQTLTSAEIEDLLTQDKVEKAFQKAVNYISHRPRTETEVRRRLRKVTSDHNIIDVVMVRLLKSKLVDDKAFADFWIENRNAFRPRGRKALRFELRAKGIDHNIIEETIQKVDDTTAASDAAMRRAPRLAKLPEREFRRKLQAFLRRRGFNYAVIASVVDEIVTNLVFTDYE